ncbi:MAG: YybH family protein [Pseudomonadales bacterium]
MPPGKITTSSNNASRAIQVCRSWVRCINEHDVEGLVSLAAEDHCFFVESESSTIGREKDRTSWLGYLAAFPVYRIYVDEIHNLGDAVYVLGHTSGSHVPPDLEALPSGVL